MTQRLLEIGELYVGYTSFGGFYQKRDNAESAEWVVVEREFHDEYEQFVTAFMRVSDGRIFRARSDGNIITGKPDGHAKSVKVKTVKSYDVVTEKVTHTELSV